MINVKDRIPTKPYRRKITHQEGYLPVYEIDENGHLIVNVPDVEYATVERADEPTEDGTPINKALFDSIDTDVQARLLIADKATQSDAITGTNDTKYMTPLKVKQVFDNNVIVNNSYSSNTTFFNFSNAGSNDVYVGDINFGHATTNPRFVINGSSIGYYEIFMRTQISSSGSGDSYEVSCQTGKSSLGVDGDNSVAHFEINMATKTFTLEVNNQTGSLSSGSYFLYHRYIGYFSSLTSLQLTTTASCKVYMKRI